MRNEGYDESLELRKIYEVLDDAEAPADGLLRVIDEDEDSLYPATWFRLIQLPEERALRPTRPGPSLDARDDRG